MIQNFQAEIDAIDHAGALVEMKTQRGELEGGFWRWKAPKWWMQSFLVGIKQIVVGHRNDNGYVRKVGILNGYEYTCVSRYFLLMKKSLNLVTNT